MPFQEDADQVEEGELVLERAGLIHICPDTLAFTLDLREQASLIFEEGQRDSGLTCLVVLPMVFQLLEEHLGMMRQR